MIDTTTPPPSPLAPADVSPYHGHSKDLLPTQPGSIWSRYDMLMVASEAILAAALITASPILRLGTRIG